MDDIKASVKMRCEARCSLGECCFTSGGLVRLSNTYTLIFHIYLKMSDNRGNEGQKVMESANIIHIVKSYFVMFLSTD